MGKLATAACELCQAMRALRASDTEEELARAKEGARAARGKVVEAWKGESGARWDDADQTAAALLSELLGTHWLAVDLAATSPSKSRSARSWAG